MLYIAGVYSGLHANKIVKQETQESIASLENYVTLLEKNLQSVQIEQIFIESLTHEQMCEYSSISMNQLVTDLRTFWEKLPFRIEAYEQHNELSEEYLKVKQGYTQLSMRTWVLAKNKYDLCDTNLIPVLYFYEIPCENCIKQGRELDKLQQEIFKKGSDILVFTVDRNADELIVQNIAAYYNITKTPAIIIGDDIYQGKVFTAEELLQ